MMRMVFRAWALLPLLPGLLVVTGCVTTTQVKPLAGSGGIALDADDIVCMMQRAGFKDEKIMDTGADLRDALAESGSARIENGNQVEAIFSLSDPLIYVSTRANGNFIYDTKSKTFR